MVNKLKISNYSEIAKLFWPIAFTLILTNSLSFVDTFMISNYDLLGPAAILATTQINFVFGPVYFAMLTGVNIYTVQYYTRNDFGKLKNLAGIALTMIITLSIISFIIICLFGPYIVRFFSASDDIYNMSLQYLQIYKFVILLIPLDMFFTYQYRAIKKPKIPLIFGTVQSLLNIFFNLILIYGLFMFPELGIKGAAIGTLLSKLIIVIAQYIVAQKMDAPFLGSIKEMFSYSREFFIEVFKNTLPLIIVEFGFGLGNIIYYKLYTTTSDVEIAAFSIAKAISFTINAFVIATANVSGILTGSAISHGVAKDDKELKKTMNGLFKFMTYNSIIIVIVSIFILPLLIPLFLLDKNNEIIANNYLEIYRLIYALIIINGIWMAIRVFSSSLIAILKSGNDNKFVILVDAGSTYLVGIPITLVVFLMFHPSIIVLRGLIIVEVITKVIIGTYRYKKKLWVRKI